MAIEDAVSKNDVFQTINKDLVEAKVGKYISRSVLAFKSENFESSTIFPETIVSWLLKRAASMSIIV